MLVAKMHAMGNAGALHQLSQAARNIARAQDGPLAFGQAERKMVTAQVGTDLVTMVTLLVGAGLSVGRLLGFGLCPALPLQPSGHSKSPRTDS